MRVVHIIGRMNVGGPAAIVTELLKNLDVDLHVLTGEVDTGEADFLSLRAPDAEVTHIRGLGRAVRPSDDIWALGGLVRQLSRLRPDIVHTHTAKAGALGRTAAAVVGVRSRVHSFHGHLLHGYFSATGTRSIVVAERTLAVMTDRMIAMGENVRDELLSARIGKPDQYVVIPPGVTLPGPVPPRDEARAVLGLPREGLIVAYVARLTKVKRPDRMIAVARAVPEATFLVAGDGPLQSELLAAAPSNVRFLGWRADIENVYSASNVILLTSDNEGMPVTLIEAALCGVPAVATNVGSTGEVVLSGRTGLIVAPGSSPLADALRSLLTNESRSQEMGLSARRWAAEAFSVQKMASAHGDLYASLMAGPPVRRFRPRSRRTA